MSFQIKVPDEYDLLSSIHSWIYPDIQPVPEQTGDGYFGRVYNVDNKQVALVIRQSKPGDVLQVNYSDPDASQLNLKTLVQWTLGLEINFKDALAQMSEDPVIAHLVNGVAGVRPYMSPTPYEALIKTIIQQQVSYRAANIFTKRMVQGLAKPIFFEYKNWFNFPDAKTITNTDKKILREFGFGYKVEYIHDTARLVAEGHLNVDSLVGVSYEEILAELTPIRGIGKWTVDVLSLAGLGDFSVFAYSDLVIQKILGKLYNHGERMTTKQVREQSLTWGDSGTKVLYLLMSAEVLGLFDMALQKTHKRLPVEEAD
ncbi:MAG: DNA-3-methyladenine glycosylase family protein [Candidatus Thorarchaeota archaeon]